MNIQEIKDAVDNSLPVYWSNQSYKVIKDSINRYLIKHDSGNIIGLTNLKGDKLNGKESDFHIVGSNPEDVVQREVLLYPMTEDGEPAENDFETQHYNVWIRVDYLNPKPNEFWHLPQYNRDYRADDKASAIQYATELASKFKCEWSEY